MSGYWLNKQHLLQSQCRNGALLTDRKQKLAVVQYDKMNGSLVISLPSVLVKLDVVFRITPNTVLEKYDSEKTSLNYLIRLKWRYE